MARKNIRIVSDPIGIALQFCQGGFLLSRSLSLFLFPSHSFPLLSFPCAMFVAGLTYIYRRYIHNATYSRVRKIGARPM